MMTFEYDPRFVEQATFFAVRNDPERECIMHEALDPLYRIHDPELRQREFRRAYGDLFRRFDLDRIVPSYTRSFPLLSERLGRCLVREADRRKSQSADLYREKSPGSTADGERVLIIALCPDCLMDADRLGPWMYRQLRHIEDMVDDRFAYECELPPAPAIQRNLMRDRYALLWDIFVEGRLLRSDMIGHDGVGALNASFDKVFARNGSMPAATIFDRMMNVDDLTHPMLVRWAKEPERLFAELLDEKNDVSPFAADARECHMLT